MLTVKRIERNKRAPPIGTGINLNNPIINMTKLTMMSAAPSKMKKRVIKFPPRIIVMRNDEAYTYLEEER